MTDECKTAARAINAEDTDFYTRKYIREDLLRQLIPIIGYAQSPEYVIEAAQKYEEYILKR